MSEVPSRLSAALSDRYLLERELGQGGMATVYLAEDVRHDRKVAVKVLRPELAAVIGAERFLQEIKVTANLQHPHILPLFDSGEADRFLFYVMPYVQGESLRDRLNLEKQLPIAEAIAITKAVAGALDYAHRHKVIHRDIKPENVLLHDGQPVVADFGIALAVSVAGGTRITETGLSLGTPQYMSPEQATGDRVLDGRTDIYALGCVLYEMLVGEPPYTGPTTQSIIAKVLTEEPRRIRVLRPALPLQLEAAAHKALSKLPADRFSSAAQFAEALSQPGTSVPSLDASVPTPVAVSRSWPPPLTKRLVALGAATLLLGALLGWGLRRRPAAYAPVARLEVPIPGDLLGAGVELAVSADGSRLVMLVVGQAGRSLYIRSLDDLEARPVAGADGILNPFFSPDGRWVAFWQVTGNRLQKLSVTGGAPITIAAIPGTMSGASWGTNDVIVVAEPPGLVAIPAGGGDARQVTRVGPGESHSWPEVLPGGKAALFTILSGAANQSLAAVDLASGKVTPLDLAGTGPHYVPPGRLVFATSDGALHAVPFDVARLRVTGSPITVAQGVSVSSSGAADVAIAGGRVLAYVAGSTRRRLVAVDRSGTVESLSEELREFDSPRFSPDGKRIALGVGLLFPSDIWVYTAASRTLSRLTLGGTNMYPAWSPDGHQLLFASDGDGPMKLFSVPADESGKAERLLAAQDPVWEGAWLPGGKGMVYRTSSPTTGRDVWYRSSGGDSTPRPVAITPYDERMPAVSPDGRWVAYVSAESGRDEVYVRPLPPQGGGRWQVSADGGTQPVWARTARELFYRRGRDVVAAAVTLAPTFGVGTRRALFSGNFYMGANSHATYDVAPDGNRFVMVATGDTARIVVVLNWLQEFRERN